MLLGNSNEFAAPLLTFARAAFAGKVCKSAKFYKEFMHAKYICKLYNRCSDIQRT